MGLKAELRKAAKAYKGELEQHEYKGKGSPLGGKEKGSPPKGAPTAKAKGGKPHWMRKPEGEEQEYQDKGTTSGKPPWSS